MPKAKKLGPRTNRVGKARLEEKLTTQQRMFVEYCLAQNPWNTTEAARLAGYKHEGVAAAKLMGNPTIAQALGRAIQERIWRCELDANRVIDELSTVAFADVRQLFDKTGLLIPVHQLPENIARAVKDIEVISRTTDDGETVTVAKIRLHPKLDAIKLLMQHMGMLQERLKVEQTTNVNILQQILSGLNQAATGCIGNQELEALADQR